MVVLLHDQEGDGQPVRQLYREEQLGTVVACSINGLDLYIRHHSVVPVFHRRAAMEHPAGQPSGPVKGISWSADLMHLLDFGLELGSKL